MDRRAFLSRAFTPASSRFGNSYTPNHNRILSTDLTAYVPSAADPWDEFKVGHLLRRTMMMPLWADMTKLMGMTPSDAVDLLISTPSTPTRPTVADHGTESLDGLDVILQEALKSTWASDTASLAAWWATVLVTSPLSLVEKMVFFWSGSFTTQFNLDNINWVQAPLLYRQNELFRNNCLASFQDMAFGITLDGAMLVFLGGDQNNQSHPNENYARELMELFTMGLGQYTEGDVKEAARILTGWHASRYNDNHFNPNGLFNTFFTAGDHDTGAKQYLGVSFDSIPDAENTEDLVRKGEITKLINTIFTVRADAVATFICRKIYRFFVYSNPGATDENVIAEMAAIFKQNNFQIKPVISALLKSQHFYDNLNIGAQIKTPAEFTVGLARQLGYAQNIYGNMANMLQQLFQPPNVSGWTGWHDWITTNTFPVRAATSTSAINAMTDQQVLSFIAQFPNNNDAKTLIKNVGVLLLPRPLSQDRQDDLVNRLVGGDGANKDYEWPTILSSSPSTAARNMRDVLTEISILPDFQLC
ncbi:MAG TPA: DUF1800 domain-containing protein [Candidatus Kapabacteria bacterium]|nr:DUF1800 domain-containing protein [Candidatus Kapabacteria bacterium]